MLILPFKLNQHRRHCVPKQKHKLMNWRAYDASLRQRGSLTVWFTGEAIEAWRAPPRTTPARQPWYSPLAILTALTLRAVFRLALRQTEGLIGSVIGLLGLTLAVPERMNATEQRFVDALIARSPELAVLISLAREFSSMVRRQ